MKHAFRLALSVAFAVGASAAGAEPVGPPEAPRGAFPPPEESILPTNAKVLFFGLREPRPVFSRTGRAEDLSFEELVISDSFSPSGGSFANYLVNPGALGGSTTLEVTSTCDECIPTTTIWNVGAEADVTPPVVEDRPMGAPQVSSAGVQDILGYRVIGWNVQVSAPPMSDDSGFGLVRIETSEGGRSISSVLTETETTLSADFEPGPLRTVCLTATALDLAGNEASFGGEVCAEIGDAPGCSAAPMSTLSVLALFAFWRTQRTRRSRYRGAHLR